MRRFGAIRNNVFHTVSLMVIYIGWKKAEYKLQTVLAELCIIMLDIFQKQKYSPSSQKRKNYNA